MRASKVFISHSTKNNANLAFLKKVCAALTPDFDVLVDLNLEAGDKWHAKISEWMHECDAAVILLNKDGLASSWVQAESTVVAVRDRNETDFKLIPVLLDGIEPEKVTCHLSLGSGSAAQLNETQFISHCPNEEIIINNITQALAGLKANTTPFEKIGEVIALLLKEVDKQVLESAWNSLGGENKPTWKQDSTPFADVLMRYLFRQQENCLKGFEDVLDKIRPKLDPIRAKEFLNYIRPLWVDAKAAACLPAIAHQQNKMAAMNGRLLQDFSFFRYIERAWPLTDKCKSITISQIDDLEIIQQQMRDHFQHSNLRFRLEPDECDEEILDSVDPVLVCLPATDAEGGLPDYRLRKDLRTLYPNVIFVMGTGDTLPTEYPEDVLGTIPALDIKNERKQWRAEGKAEAFLDKYCG